MFFNCHRRVQGPGVILPVIRAAPHGLAKRLMGGGVLLHMHEQLAFDEIPAVVLHVCPAQLQKR